MHPARIAVGIDDVAGPRYRGIGGDAFGDGPFRVVEGGLEESVGQCGGAAVHRSVERAQPGTQGRVDAAPGAGRHPGGNRSRRQVVVGQQNQRGIEQ